MRPPTVAMWLLRTFVHDANTLEGDLLEACREGRSASWIWRQVVGATVASLVGDIRAHGLSVAVCLVVGWLVAWQAAPVIVRFTVAAAIRSYDRWYFANGGVPPPHSGDFILMLNFGILMFTNVAGGFAAVRWHTGERRLIAVLFAATVVVERMLPFVWHSTVYEPTVMQLYYVFRPAGATVIALIALEWLSALAGGVAGARR